MSNLIEYDVIKSTTNIWGLKHHFSIADRDFDDWTAECNQCKDNVKNVSECNVDVLLSALSTTTKLIVEIGVCKDGTSSWEESSAKAYIEKKPSECAFIGIDLNDKSFITTKGENVHFIQANSKDIDSNIGKIKNIAGHDEIDILFIDGFHSVEMCLNDWQYAKWVKKGGYVLLHDTNFHPGPWCLVDAVDPKLFDITKCCETKDDFGITIMKRI